MDYELRIIVEKVAVSSQEVVKRDTIKIYDIQRPESIIDLGIGQKYAPDLMRIRERRGSSTWASDRQKGFSCFV
jgi:hypothetical protein